MNVEREINDIKARLDRIEALLVSPVAGHAVQNDPGTSYDLVDLQVEKSESIIGPEYAYRLTVRNTGRGDTQFMGRIIFLDSSEFEVESHVMEPFTVPAGKTVTRTGKATVLDQNHAHRIADVTAEIRPI